MKSSAAGVPSGAAGRSAGLISTSAPSSQSRIASDTSMSKTSPVTLPASTWALSGVAGLSASIMLTLMPVFSAKGLL